MYKKKILYEKNFNLKSSFFIYQYNNDLKNHFFVNLFKDFFFLVIII